MTWLYHGVVGNDPRDKIMSIEKTTVEKGIAPNTSEGRNQLDAAKTPSNEHLKVLSLEIEDDNFGADPYNRTGQFCKIKLDDRD